MTKKEKVESFLVELALSYEEVAANTWLIHNSGTGLENMVVMLSEPLVVIRVKVMEAPAAGREKFFEELLRLNAEDLLHGAYALEAKNVILIDTLEVETMDLHEFRASIEALSLALVGHYKLLSRYRQKS